LGVASKSRLTQAAACTLNLSPKLLYKWQQEALPMLTADTTDVVEVR